MWSTIKLQLQEPQKKRNLGEKARQDPKHTVTATQKWFKDNEVNILEWPSQSPDLNPIRNLWLDLKRAVRARSPFLIHLTEPEQFCKE